MNSSNRILVGFGVGIALLVVITLVLVLAMGQQSSPRLPADTPEGTVQSYLLALKDGDYIAARTFLLIPDTGNNRPGYPLIPPYPVPYRSNNPSPWKANLGQTNVTGDQATVEVTVDNFSGPSGPFDNPVRTMSIIFSLEKGPGGRWLITQPLDAYWLY